MPAPGDQHERTGLTTNPFEPQRPRISEYTAQEIAALSSKLEKRLGPEFISARPGAAGQKVHYLAAEKCINLANEVFGFNGWSSSIQNINLDFMTESEATGKVSLGISVVVRVTLKDGTYHEDIGYGQIENCKSKAAAFEKAKKEGTTDGLKRALRNFGNVLGNCIYDKEYVAKVTKIKVPPSKWNSENLHRHSDFAPVKKEPVLDTQNESLKNIPSFGELEDEFGGDEFDEVDFSESHVTMGNPDEVAVEVKDLNRTSKNGSVAVSTGPSPAKERLTPAQSNQMKAPANRVQSLPAVSAQTTGRQPPNGPQVKANMAPDSGNGGSVMRQANNGVQHPNTVHLPTNGTPQRGQQHSNGNSSTADAQPYGTSRQSSIHQAPNVQGRSGSGPSQNQGQLPPNPPVEFFNARAASLVQDPITAASPTTAPTFNPHSESPSIRKTSGVDHTKSKPIVRDALVQAPNQVPATTGLPNTGAVTPIRSTFTNPQLDSTRKIGMPNSPALGQGNGDNRGSYKPPWPAPGKRATDNPNLGSSRTPLGELKAEKLNSGPTSIDIGAGGDVKKQKLSDSG
ncbi:MAG: hypothetical protein M4579_004786 [Chaenotheca gracillima]|nr:MAG: hypothetical protein M4579_004786 [Chaenotheca gracillima]